MSISADVIVVGFGPAGATAALTAAQRGADVLIVEKQSLASHMTSAHMTSGGVIMSVSDVNAAVRYLDACAGGLTPSVVNRAWASRASAIPEWLDTHGIATARVRGGFHESFDGHDSIDVLAMSPAASDDREPSVLRHMAVPGVPLPEPRGSGFPRAIEAAALNHPRVRVAESSRARRLVRNGPKVSGVLCVDRSGRRIEMAATSGVVLASGGFQFDEALKRDHLSGEPIHFYGADCSTGDGIRMAQLAGADLWHMNCMVGRAVGHFDLDDQGLTFMLSLSPPPYMIIDQSGRRFTDESAQAKFHPYFYQHLLPFDPITSRYYRIPSYWIFDAQRLASGPLTPAEQGLSRVGRYKWSSDNSREIELGWISPAASIPILAEAIGVDSALLQETFDDYQEACRLGHDRYGRPRETLLPFEEGPLFAVRLFPGGASTLGGPRRDAQARVVDADGMPIEGLFAAGELGSVIGRLYPAAGSNYADAVAFGQIAAESATA